MKKHGKKQKKETESDKLAEYLESCQDIVDRFLGKAYRETIDAMEKEKLPNDIEASIPVSEFAAYCSALDEKRYLKAFDIRNRKTPSKSFFSSAYNYEGYNWANEALKKSPLPDLSYESVRSNPHKGYFDIINELNEGTWIDAKSNFEKLMSIKKPKTKEMKNKLSDKGLENFLSIPKEEIEAEIERRTIGYLFNNEKAYDKFVGAFKLLTGRLYLIPYEKGGFYIDKGCFYDIPNKDCDSHLQFAKKYNILNELFTPVYKEENELQSGKWYKTNEDETLWFINSIDDNGDGNGYGFLFGQWAKSNTIALNNKKFDFKEASKEYVESMLIKEAKKRGLKEWAIANSMDGKESFRIKGGLYFSKQMNTLYCRLSDRYAPIFKNGIWIELKKESNYKTELNKALDNIDKVRKAIEKLDSAIKKIKSND